MSLSATIIHFPNPLAKAFAAVEHGMYWAVQELATSRHQRLIAEADAMLRTAAEFRRYVRENTDDDPPLLRWLADHYSEFNAWRPDKGFTGQGRVGP